MAERGSKPTFCFVSASLLSYLQPSTGITSGGAQRQQYLIGRELLRRGYSIGTIVGDYGQPSYVEFGDLTIANGCPMSVDSTKELPSVICRLVASMRRIDADAYYVRGAPRLAIATRLGCSLLRKPMVFCVANDADVEPAHLERRYGTAIQTAYRWTIKTADVVIAQTSKQRSILKDKFGVDARVVPNGYTLPPTEEIVPAERRSTILWVGSSDPEQKRPERFLRLAYRLPSYRFVMISQPMEDLDYHDSLHRAAESLDNLALLGRVSPERVHEHYREAQLVVCTSAFEGFPNTFLEAWRYATPVVSDRVDVEGHLASNRGGHLVEDFEDLVHTVAHFVDRPDVLDEIGRQGRQLVAENYALETVVDTYEDIIEEVTPVEPTLAPKRDSTPLATTDR